jgi:pyruvate formate lyase activating enzyme
LKINIKKMIETSLIDWEGKIVSTLYVSNCNFRCPYCYNYDLILNPNSIRDIFFKDISNSLLERKDFIDGICISGGEPTLYTDLPSYLTKIKDKGFLIKLDTNGTNPELLEDLLKFKLIDYIAMDIKSSLDFEYYFKATGIRDKILFEKVKDSIKLIISSGTDYEFRTTIVPVLHTEENIIEIAKYISGTKKYFLQNFIPTEGTLDPSFQKIKPYSNEKMQEFVEKVKRYIPNCSFR